MNEIKEGQTSGIDFKFLKSKPLNITNREEIKLITKITIIKPETIIEDIKNKTIEEKLKLLDIVYSDNQGIYTIFREVIKDINVSKVDGVFKIEFKFIDFISNEKIVGFPPWFFYSSFSKWTWIIFLFDVSLIYTKNNLFNIDYF